MATMATAVCDIAMTSGRDNLTAVAARSVPVTNHPTTLPTPPNSISPSLPPHGLKAQLQLQRARLASVDSDLDLHDAPDEHAGHGSPPCDASGAITAAMLAKFHLPEILLNHGPLPIRHVMGYLTTSVPGFAGISPAKARRLVVGALEGKGSAGEGGGVDGDVEFIKVGWGRWDAKRRGQPARYSNRLSPGANGAQPGSIPIIKTTGWNMDRSRLGAALGSSLGGGSSAAFSHDDRFMDMMDHEADKMSLDGSGSASCSEAPDDDDMGMRNDDPEDATDDEDWAAVGAAALRASSYQPQSTQQQFSFNTVYTPGGGGGIRSFSGGMARPPQLPNLHIPASAFGAAASDAQEREAVEALLRLGSM